MLILLCNGQPVSVVHHPNLSNHCIYSELARFLIGLRLVLLVRLAMVFFQSIFGPIDSILRSILMTQQVLVVGRRWMTIMWSIGIVKDPFKSVMLDMHLIMIIACSRHQRWVIHG